MTERTRVKWLERIVRWVVGGLFVMAGVLKMRDPEAFAESIISYELVSLWLVNPVAIGLPAVEVVLGGMLVMRWRGRAAAFGLGVMTLVFTLAISQGLVRGLDMDCGCFGEADLLGKSPWTALIRDIVLLVALGWLWLRDYTNHKLEHVENL